MVGRDRPGLGVADAPEVEVGAGRAVGRSRREREPLAIGRERGRVADDRDAADDRQRGRGGRRRPPETVGVGVGVSIGRSGWAARMAACRTARSARRIGRGRGGVTVGVGLTVGAGRRCRRRRGGSATARRAGSFGRATTKTWLPPLSSEPTTIAWPLDGDVMIDFGRRRQGDPLACAVVEGGAAGLVEVRADLVHLGRVVGVRAVGADIEPADEPGIDGDRRGTRHDRDIGGGGRRRQDRRPPDPSTPPVVPAGVDEPAALQERGTDHDRDDGDARDGAPLGEWRAPAPDRSTRDDGRRLPARWRPTVRAHRSRGGSGESSRAGPRRPSRSASYAWAVAGSRRSRRGGRPARPPRRARAVSSRRSAARDVARSWGEAQASGRRPTRPRRLMAVAPRSRPAARSGVGGIGGRFGGGIRGSLDRRAPGAGSRERESAGRARPRG